MRQKSDDVHGPQGVVAVNWLKVISLGGLFIISVGLLFVARHTGDPSWLRTHLSAAEGSDAVLWQVQTMFLSVGFAGLAIAAQLFAEAPLAIGASRRRVLDYIGASWFLGVGLVANVVIAIETIWLSSGVGILVVALLLFMPTVVLLVVSAIKLMELFGHPSLLDEVIRTSLVESLSNRLDTASCKSSLATKQLDGLVRPSSSLLDLEYWPSTLRVPAPRDGLVIKAIRPSNVKQVRDILGLRAIESNSVETEGAEIYRKHQIILVIWPGDRTRLGETVFLVKTFKALEESEQGTIVRLLQSSIEFEVSGSVTPGEETDREITNLMDAVGISLRSGAFATAERALELLGHVIRGVWMIQPVKVDSSPRASFGRQDWFRSIGEVEQDALLSPRAAGMFVGKAMTRAVAAPRTGSTEYVDECLRSFTRLWLDVLQHGGTEFDQLPARIIVCVQNLAAFSAPDQRVDLSSRATWALVELVKLALDAHRPVEAVRAAEELSGLFEYSGRGDGGRAHVRAGQLVLAGWLDYLEDNGDARDPADTGLRSLLTPRGTWAEILAARNLAERGETPFIRWDWWERKLGGSAHFQSMELSNYIDRAQLVALGSSYGPIPPATDQRTASDYQRFLRLLDEPGSDLGKISTKLKQGLTNEIAEWKRSEDARLVAEPLSDTRIEVLRTALRETLDVNRRLADEIPAVRKVPAHADTLLPILGMNFLIPRHYLVDNYFNQTFSDPSELGQMIAGAITDGEERKIIEILRSMNGGILAPVAEINKQITELEDQAQYHILLTPHGGLMDLDVWYSADFSEVLARVTHIETSALDEEAILFDRRETLFFCRKPEEKEGLTPVDETSIALGVFEDAQGGNEPQVRVEVGEYFVVWPGSTPRVLCFGSALLVEGNTGASK